jgi:hypothetical protein
MSRVEDLLEQCTVKLSLPGQMGWGTGFFVAPEWILTCAHVVKGAKGKPVQVWWQKQENWSEAVVEDLFPDPYDLALLRVTLPTDANPPCVYLDEAIQSRDPLYLFGYPDQDFDNGCPVTLNCEGLTGDEPELIKLALGQVRPGMSGAPLLNQRTGKVCGIVKFTRDRSFDLGGGAVPTAAILEQFPQLREFQQQFHQRDRRWRDLERDRRRRNLEPKPSLTRQEYHNRQALLTKVNNFWVKGVLEKSLYNQVIIELGLEEHADAVVSSWNMELETTEATQKPLPKGTKVISIFDQLGEGRTLLILGEPGSGKTTSLLELTRDLVNRSEQGLDYRIPVVFNLSSWEGKKQTIADWLVGELNSKYQVPKQIGQDWVKKQELLLLLDGLDEVDAEKRDSCVAALNDFNQNYAPEMVVCSRIKDYSALSNRLNFQSAIYLKSLKKEQVVHYLDSIKVNLTGLRALIEEDRALQELAKSPLMLNIMVLAYEGVAVEYLPKAEVMEERRKQLFDAYIERMFHRPTRLKVEQRYSPDQSIRWLTWLAQTLVQESQTVFLIEEIQPTRLTTKAQKKLYRIGVFLIIWLFYGVISGLIFGLFLNLIYGVISGLIFGLFLGLFCWFTSIGGKAKIRTVETLNWFGKEVKKMLIIGLKNGLIVGLIVGLIFALSGEPKLIVGLIMGLIVGLFFGLIFGLIDGIKGSAIATKTIPNQGIYKTAKNAGIIGLIIWLIVGLIFTLSSGELIFGLFFGLTFGLIALIVGGGKACIQHSTLRLILYRDGYIPWNYTRFLDYAAERIFLQKVGGGYIFIHRLLLEHFAQMECDRSR